MSAYMELKKRYGQISAIEGAAAMLNWDAETFMPKGSSDVRGEQLAALASIAHEKYTADDLGDLLAAAKQESLTGWDAANLKEMERVYVHANAVPNDLVQALAKAQAETTHVWQQARPENDYDSFSAKLGPLLGLVRQAAEAKADALGLSPYDAQLDSFDPGMRSEKVDVYFDELGAFLPDFLNEAIEFQNTHRPVQPLAGDTTVAAQEALGRRFMDALGFDFNHGRIDVSAHPFCGGVPGDIRLTTRYNKDEFSTSLYGVLHETGHAMYEMGLPSEWQGQPVGEARGMSMHESQSLFLDMQLCRSDAFLSFALPLIREAFGVSGSAWEMENFQRSILRVNRGLIRVDADEVTYPLHVMLRYRIEKAMLNGDLQLADLPGFWDDEMHKSVGVRPDCLSNGCMQDIHWSGGALGYFPTYTIGAMTAAQLFKALQTQVSGWDDSVRKGDFAPIFAWLRENVHHKASSQTMDEIVSDATGSVLDVSLFKQHLKERYLTN